MAEGRFKGFWEAYAMMYGRDRLRHLRPVSAQMLEGTLSGTFAAFGTVNAKATGKERTVLAMDENGLSVTDGVLDHMTWHCSGLADFTNGIGQTQGYCAGRDPVGDQVVFNWGVR